MRYWYTLTVLLICASTFYHCSPPGEASAAKQNPDVPGWLFAALQKHLDNPSVLEKEDISYSYVWLKAGDRPQVVANARIDRLNGVLAVFEHTGNGYREVYVKLEPVYEVSVAGHRRQWVMFVSGLGGTGVQNNFYHLLGYTGGQYTEVWSGVAVASQFTGPLPSTYTNGALRFDPGLSQFLYTQTTLHYQQHDFEWNKPSGQKTTTWLFSLDPETGRVKDSSLIQSRD
jgi:hypothetical protein